LFSTSICFFIQSLDYVRFSENKKREKGITINGVKIERGEFRFGNTNRGKGMDGKVELVVFPKN
jgi:hypothetical protein